jgi:hypothetical protein
MLVSTDKDKKAKKKTNHGSDRDKESNAIPKPQNHAFSSDFDSPYIRVRLLEHSNIFITINFKLINYNDLR